MAADRDREFLAELQAMSLNDKFQRTLGLVGEWHNHFNNQVYVSLSGGKDSTVLADIDAKWCKAIGQPLNLVFSNTGLEYPEIQRHVRELKPYFESKYGIEVNLTILRPKMQFNEVVTRYGYPLISKEVSQAIYEARTIIYDEKPHYRKKRKQLQGEYETDSNLSQFNMHKWLTVAETLPVKISHFCCAKMKKQPIMQFQKRTCMKPFLGTMAEESRLRTQAWIRHGCNAFESKKNTSQPLSFWREQDILAYTLAENLPLASVYGDIVAVDELGNEYEPQNLIAGCGKLKCTGCQRTGCIFCGFGAHLEKPGEGRFERLAYTHPKQYDYCINGGHWVDNPHYDPTAPEYDGEWKNWNPKQIWTPDEKGLGMGKVFEMVNEIYGKEFIRY